MPLPTQSVLPDVLFETCRGLQAAIEFPRDAAHLPTAFRAEGVVEASARLNIEALSCAKVTAPRSLHLDVGILWLAVAAEATNASWQKWSSSAYALQLLSADGALVPVLREAGAPAEVATFTRESALDVGGARHETWTFRAGETVYRLRWPVVGQAQDAAHARDRHFWSGTGPFQRIDVHEVDGYAGPRPVATGLFQVEGSGPVQDLLPADGMPFIANIVADSRWDVVARPQSFEVTP